jgi:hypothetical protein
MFNLEDVHVSLAARPHNHAHTGRTASQKLGRQYGNGTEAFATSITAQTSPAVLYHG